MVYETKTTSAPARLRTQLRRSSKLQRATSIFVPSSLLLTALLLMMILRPLALTEVVEIPADNVIVRPFGDPEVALARIEEENFTSIDNLDRLSRDAELNPLQRLVYRYAPLILSTPGDFPREDDTFIGVYYLISETVGEEITVTTIQYFYFSTDESGGTLIRERLALFGDPIDRELIYRVTIIDNEVASSYFQAPRHRLTPYQFSEDIRPVFEIASANHNFRPVLAQELELRQDYLLLAALPQHELRADPAHDPDFIALAAEEAIEQYGVNLSEYIYVEFQNPVRDGPVTISVQIERRWYYLHDSIAGLTRPGYNQVGIHVGFAPPSTRIDKIWLVAYTTNPVDLEVISIYIYPRINIQA